MGERRFSLSSPPLLASQAILSVKPKCTWTSINFFSVTLLLSFCLKINDLQEYFLTDLGHPKGTCKCPLYGGGRLIEVCHKLVQSLAGTSLVILKQERS